MKKIYEKKRIILIIGGIVILIVSLVLYLLNDTKKIEDEIVLNITTEKNITSKKDEKESFYVDVKGNVKKPGVYKFEYNDRVIDAIEMAGGLKKNANTDNINLSEKLKSEMVVYVYSDSEVKTSINTLSCDTICETNIIEVNNCIDTPLTNSKNEDLININTSSLEELLTLSGIGESKAKSIIEYRTANGNFKSIEEIKNVSGIGDALYEKIKDKITV